MSGALTGVVDLRVLICAGCGDDREFEQPPCADGHDVCPEWACVDCGYAVFLDPVGVEAAVAVLASAPGGITAPEHAGPRRHAA